MLADYRPIFDLPCSDPALFADIATGQKAGHGKVLLQCLDPVLHSLSQVSF